MGLPRSNPEPESLTNRIQYFRNRFMTAIQLFALTDYTLETYTTNSPEHSPS